jgi:hypothetical protein
MEKEESEVIIKEIIFLHRSMKNAMEVVFGISPLFALSTHGWSRSYHGTSLLRVSEISLFSTCINFYFK